MEDDRLRLRSYRLAFELERRIHRIDTFQIPLPYGLPLTALGWGTGVLVLMVLASGLPGVGAVLAGLPWPLRLIFVPGLAAHLLCREGSDGRPIHECLLARVAFLARRHHRVGLRALCRAAPPAVAVPCVPDERTDVYRAGVVRGPAAVALRQPARVELGHTAARLAPLGDQPLPVPQELRLREGQRLVVV
ncbi:TcpE family conjugal transfer membrane protein [Paraconexibacter antarcticus]|uniref:TcpE family conjugal transfer membrane protein n=1 Tax=Paraconexibacter antarcticus TaxID=2949664 RepID=A0ABY5DZ34_9ACTN|nr:TcpE family conjugal transfer membrane protein [Paraconexibacter antarcticus]UTI66137.1 TcpE family conjugal transfer membrane protein [Paraconexibacter antarcticus]